MKKLVPIILLLAMLVASPAWADINVQTVNTAPYSQNFTLFNTDATTVNEAVHDAVSENAYLKHSFPAFNKQDFNLFVVSQTAFCGAFEQGDTVYGTNNAYLFTIKNVFFSNRIPSVVAHELGHEVRFMYLNTEELNQYIKQRGVTDAEQEYFTTMFPNQIMNEEVFAEDFRQLFGGPNAQTTIYYDTVPPPTNADRQWILDHVSSASLTTPLN